MTDMPLQWNVCTLLCADTRGHGRYIIKKFETEWLLELNGELIGKFNSPDEAKARAEIDVKTARKIAAESAAPGWRAQWKDGAFQWVQAPPGNRSSRKQPEQSWR